MACARACARARARAVVLQQAIFVHCSAGVGRTGTFIALQHAMMKLEATGGCDALEIIEQSKRSLPIIIILARGYQHADFVAYTVLAAAYWSALL